MDKVVLISQKEMEERENKYVQRLQDVAVSCAFVKDAATEFEELEAKQAKLDHWEHYILCDGLPRPYLPPEMRTFLAKKRHYQQFDCDRSIDWTLSSDERTILTQDIYRKDKTRNTMKVEMNDPVGDRFEADIRMYLDMLVKIDCMLDNRTEMSRITFEHQMEIMEARKELEQEIDDSFDRLTYRILRMDEVYMASHDGIVATWGHKCDRYAIDIWALRNVPIRFSELIAPMMVAELEQVRARVQMPLSVLHDCLTLRCIHMRFDNYSQYAKSFDPIIPDEIKEYKSGILDIEDSLVSEWLMQLNIQDELLTNMLQRREAYEEILLIIAERTEKAAKEKKANTDPNAKKKSIIIPSAPREPPKVPPGMLPDAYSAFLEQEQQDYVEMLDQLYNPKHHRMLLDEINLREYILLGGLYSIMFVRRPASTAFEKFNIVLHEDGRVLYTMDDVVADLRSKEDLFPRDSKQMGGRSRSHMRLNMDAKGRKSSKLEDDELPYFFVTLQLPPELCRWGEPVVCQYITSMEEVLSDVSLVIDERKETIKKKKSKLATLARLAELQELHEPRDSLFTKISPRKSTLENVFRPTLISMLRHSTFPVPSVWAAPVRNFRLQKPLNHIEIRQLERYGVPRVISSFKLPQEVREDMEQDRQKPKTKNMLMRRRSADVEEIVDLSYIDYSFQDQHSPERVFPVFTGIETMKYHIESLDQENYNDKKSFYGLIETFDNIRRDYNTQYLNIMNRIDFEPKKTKKAVVPLAPGLDTTTPRSRSIINKGSSRSASFRGSHTRDSAHSSSSNAELVESGESAEYVDGSRTTLGFEEVAERPKVKLTRWTTKHIFTSTLNRSERVMTIKTDRLGIFGLAFKRYEHFPFRDWSLQPNEENHDEIILTVDTFHARVVLYISAQGNRGYVTDIVKGYVANPVKYLEIQTPIPDFRVLRRRFYEKSINIFAEHDASYYIDNGYFSVKHVALEDHTYDAMALHCKLMKFYRSSWNRLASRRDILLCMKNAKDQSDYTEVTVRLTPESATFVEVSELCSDDLDVIKLDFKSTWRNMSNYTDLHQAITSMNPHATDVRNKDALLLWRVKRMLNEIHVMSYS